MPGGPGGGVSSSPRPRARAELVAVGIAFVPFVPFVSFVSFLLVLNRDCAGDDGEGKREGISSFSGVSLFTWACRSTWASGACACGRAQVEDAMVAMGIAAAAADSGWDHGGPLASPSPEPFSAWSDLPSWV